MTTKRRCYFTMVLHPEKGWTRVGKAYASRTVAASWLPVVHRAWQGCRARVAQCTVRYVAGRLDAASVETLDRKFNMEAPR